MATLIVLRHEHHEQGTGSVMAYHYDADNRPSVDIVDLFGSHILPTPFSDMRKAFDCVSANNPQALVKIDK